MQAAHEVPVDVVGVVLILDKRTIGEDFPDPYLPELAREHLEVLHQLLSPWPIPGRVPLWIVWTKKQNRVLELLEGNLIVGRWEKAVGVQRVGSLPYWSPKPYITI